MQNLYANMDLIRKQLHKLLYEIFPDLLNQKDLNPKYIPILTTEDFGRIKRIMLKK